MVLSRSWPWMRIALGTVLLGSGIAAAVAGTAAASPEDELSAAPLDDDEAAATTPEDEPPEPEPAPLPPLPGAREFVSGLDLECFNTTGPALNQGLTLTHLNPVLLALGLPSHNVIIRELRQTCVPVRKNGVFPSPAALPFIRHVDFACYRIEAAPLPNPVPLNLTHLNPVLAGLPVHGVRLLQPEQLCLPVRKNNVVPPAAVLSLIRFLDLECWRVEPGAHPVFGVNLQQLNPQLAGIPPHGMTLIPTPRQLCVPVRKNTQAIPAAVLNIIRWVDLEKFTSAQPINLPAVGVVLHHLNPLFAAFPPVQVALQQAVSLMVPVAKNGQFPPPP
jgi:hypothetical protein